MLVEDVDVLGQHTHVTTSGGASVYMMCVCEQPVDEGEVGRDTVRIGIVCIDTASGDIVYDEWEDGELRQNLASRVAHLQPRELLLPEHLSSTTSKLLKRLVAPLALSQASAVRSESTKHPAPSHAIRTCDCTRQSTARRGDLGGSLKSYPDLLLCRVEVMKKHHFSSDSAATRIRKFFEQASSGSSGAEEEIDDSAEFGCVREGKRPSSRAFVRLPFECSVVAHT